MSMRRRSLTSLRRPAQLAHERRQPADVRPAGGAPGARCAMGRAGAPPGPRGRGGRDLRGGVCAINGWNSHSGMSALRALIAPLSAGSRFFARIEVSGSHRASLAMIARGEADVAAIDCVVHALLVRHRPAAVAGTRPLGRTPSAPAPPFVARASAGEATVARLRAALFRALDDPALEA